MDWRRPIWRFLDRRKWRPPREAGEALFQGLRLRLTLWYCGVLGAALVLFSLSLYFGAQYFLLNPAKNNAQMHANGLVSNWLEHPPEHACPLASNQPPPNTPDPESDQPVFEMVACFNQDGSLLQNGNSSQLPSAFLTNDLVREALQSGQPQNNVVDVGGNTGKIYRYAVPVPGSVNGGYAGVVLVGERVQDQETALSLLLTLLLSVGGVALLGAGLGGLFLASRALAPARLAWANQQRFIADASHELRMPLTLLRADAEVLLRGPEHLDAEDAVLLKDIVAETNHMSIIASNLLMLARLDAWSHHREHEVVNLAELAHDGVQRVQAFAEESGITVSLESTDVPFIIGDPTLLAQAVLALLDNAIKYNHRGGSITVRTAVQREQALLEVRDTGIGISPEHVSHLGERFYRVDKARSREAGGTGLGLSIARGIAATHGGRLTLSSIPAEGTTVTLILPLARDKHA